jgi:hypothetical protein
MLGIPLGHTHFPSGLPRHAFFCGSVKKFQLIVEFGGGLEYEK